MDPGDDGVGLKRRWIGKLAKVLAKRLREALLSEAWRSRIIWAEGSRRTLDGQARKEEGSGSSALSSAESKKGFGVGSERGGCVFRSF